MADVPPRLGLLDDPLSCWARKRQMLLCKETNAFFPENRRAFLLFLSSNSGFLPKKSSFLAIKSLSLRTGITGFANIVK
jgi:hypothetical protein